MVEEKWPHTYEHLLLLTSMPSIGALEVLDSLVLASASKDSLSEGLTIWQFPALPPLTRIPPTSKSLHLRESLLTSNMAMLLAGVKEVL
jgi:hypothetical protein